MSENNAYVRAFYVLVHFFAVPCKTITSNDQIIGFVENVNTRRLNLNGKAIPSNSAPGKSSHIKQTKQIGTTAK